MNVNLLKADVRNWIMFVSDIIVLIKYSDILSYYLLPIVLNFYYNL
jgi:hypothetical protein